MTTVDDAPATATPEIGNARKRKEDQRLLTGRTKWTDNIQINGMLHLAMVRSPLAHAKITSVEGGSPADKAGLKKDDVVIAIDGKTTAQGSALTGYVRQYSANDKVKLTVIRDSKKQDIDVTLAERKDS